MTTIKECLGFLAMIKTYGIMFVGVLILISAIGFLYNTISGNYKKSPSSKISYLPECTEDEIKNKKCKIEISYTDGTTIYKDPIIDPNPEAKVGNVTVFYKEHNPKSYTITNNPYLLPGMFSCVACVTLSIGLVRLMILTSKDGAAIVGMYDFFAFFGSGKRKNIGGFVL